MRWFACCAVLLAAATATGSETVLLDFSSANCGPCHQMRPVMQRLAAAGYPVREVSIDQEPQLAAKHGVTQVPTFVMLAAGREVGRHVGTTTYEHLVQMLAASGFKSPGSSSGENALPALQSPLSSNPGPSAIATRSAALANSAGSVAPKVITAVTHASVRIRVRDGQGASNGSGTIVDVHDDEALVLTCGHIFRDSDGKGAISVDVFGPHPVEGRPAELIAYDLKRDVGLVSFRPGVRVVAAPVARLGGTVQVGDPVVSVGCDHGAPPTARTSKINAVNKFLGPANLIVAGEPTQGRSGGGLFNARGEVIGVCNAADPTVGEGLFAALTTIHEQLDDAHLSFLYRGDERPPTSVSDRRGSGQKATIKGNLAAPLGGGSTTLPATALPPGAEVVCIVRSLDDPRAKSDVYVLDRVSPEFLRLLEQERARQQARAPTTMRDDLPWRRGR